MADVDEFIKNGRSPPYVLVERPLDDQRGIHRQGDGQLLLHGVPLPHAVRTGRDLRGVWQRKGGSDSADHPRQPALQVRSDQGRRCLRQRADRAGAGRQRARAEAVDRLQRRPRAAPVGPGAAGGHDRLRLARRRVLDHPPLREGDVRQRRHLVQRRRRAVPGRRAPDEDQRHATSDGRRGIPHIAGELRESCAEGQHVGRLVRGPFAGRHGARVWQHRRQRAMEAGAGGERHPDGAAGDDHGRQRPAHLARLRRPRPRDLPHAPLGQRGDHKGRRHEDNGGREDHDHLRLVRRRRRVRRGGGDGRPMRRPLFGGPRDEGDDVGAGHAGLHRLPGHVRARHPHGGRGVRRH